MKYDLKELKAFFPELDENDFQNNVSSVINRIIKDNAYEDSLKGNNLYLNTTDKLLEIEDFPYQNITNIVVKSVWSKYWNNNVQDSLLDPYKFNKNIFNNLSQIAFSYFIRCFAEQIKSFNSKNLENDDTYINYVTYLIDSDLKDFLTDYRIIWNRCINHLSKIVISLNKVIMRTTINRSLLQKEFKISKNLKIKDIIQEGDTHNSGSAVSVVIFENDSKIIYKPRSISGESSYYKFISQLNDKFKTNFHACKALNLEEYGFTEFIVTDEKPSKNLERAGELACLMYLMNASDMHYSNIIWSEEYPIPVDLETLFQPYRIKIGLPESKKSAYSFLEKSVYGTGMLPISIGNKKNDSGFDVGFLGIRDKNSESPFRSLNVINGFTKNIEVIWDNQKHANINVPSINKYDEKKLLKNCNKIVAGFSKTFSTIITKKNDFISLVTQNFSGVKFRYIHNMTYRYEQVLRSLTDATASKNIKVSKLLLSRLAILSLTSDKNIVLSEARQIWNGDVPYFTFKFDDDQITHNGINIAKLKETPMDTFVYKIQNIQSDDAEKQIKLIKLTFMGGLPDPDVDNSFDNPNQFINFISKDKHQDTVNTIKNIIEQITTSVLDDRFAHLPKTWIGPVSNNNKWTPGVLGYDLYSGRIGIALALSYAAKTVNNKEAEQLSFDIFNKSSNILQSDKVEIRSILESGTGAYSGISGLLWALFSAGKLFKQNSWIEAAKNSWNLIDENINIIDQNFFDMISGNSGSMVMRYKVTGDFKLTEKQINRIVDLANHQLNSVYTHKNNDLPIGFAHGISQIMWFIAILNQNKQDPRLELIIQKVDLIIKKRYIDLDEFKLYPDTKNKPISSTWCNGLSGLLLAYYEGYKANCINKEDIKQILSKLSIMNITNIPILCHGSIGTYECVSYLKEDFPLETNDILKKLSNTSCLPNYINEYYTKGNGRYPLGMGLLSGKAGSLLFLSKLLNSEITCNPLTMKI